MESDSSRDGVSSTLTARVLASVSMGLKGALMDQGVWDLVRARLEREAPDALALLDGAEVNGWVPLDAHVRITDIATNVIGVDAMRALGRNRILGAKLGALFPNMVRSWTRTFAEDPTQIIQVGPHIWKAGTENCGELKLISLAGNIAHFCFEDAPPEMDSSPGWRAMLEGVALGVLELAGLEAEIHLGRPDPRTHIADATVKWRRKD